MLKKSSIWLAVLISLLALTFIATSCTKKQVIKEEAVTRPGVEAKKEEVRTPEIVGKEVAPPALGEEIKEEAKMPEGVAEEEAKEELSAFKEEAKVPEMVGKEVAPPALEEEIKEEAKMPEMVAEEKAEEEAAVPEEEAKEEAAAPEEEEAKVPEIAPEEEAKVPQIAPEEEARVPEVAPEEEARVPEVAPEEEAKVPEAAPREEAKPEEGPAPFDLAGLRIQFAFDDYNLSNQAKENLEKIASWMSKNPTAKIQIEGHTCEIGTNEYNLALGDRRANSAKRYLEALGVSFRRISTISYGEERPLDPGHTEEALSKNRRDEFGETK